jgi:hypothetical protein
MEEYFYHLLILLDTFISGISEIPTYRKGRQACEEITFITVYSFPMTHYLKLTAMTGRQAREEISIPHS